MEEEEYACIFQIDAKTLEGINVEGINENLKLNIHKFFEGILYFSVHSNSSSCFYASKISIEEKNFEIIFNKKLNLSEINFFGPWNDLNKTLFG
jgi:hypothetical protein